MRLAAVSRLDVQADFAEMLVGFLIFKGFDDIGQREVTVNDRAHAVGIDGADHVLLLAAATDQHALQAHLFDQRRHEVHGAADAAQNTNDRDVTGNAHGNHRLFEGRGAAHFNDVIDATATGQCPGCLTPTGDAVQR